MRAKPLIRPIQSQRRGNSQQVDRLLILLFITFAVGTFIGCAAGCSFEISGLNISTLSSSAEFLDCLWCAAQFHILVIAAALIRAGVLLIPCVVLFRGFLLACTLSVLMEQSIIAGCITCGLPALFQLPSLFLLACAGMRFAAALHERNNTRGKLLKSMSLGRHILLSFTGIVLCAVTDYFIVPRILSNLIIY